MRFTQDFGYSPRMQAIWEPSCWYAGGIFALWSVFLNLHCIFTGQRFRVKLEMGRLGKALGMTRKQEVYKSSFCMKHRLGCFVISLCVWVGGSCPFWLGPMVWILPLIWAVWLNLSLWTLWMSLLFPELWHGCFQGDRLPSSFFAAMSSLTHPICLSRAYPCYPFCLNEY